MNLSLLPTCIKDSCKQYNHYTIYVTQSEQANADYLLILSRNHHNCWGGQQRHRLPGESVIGFDWFSPTQDFHNSDHVTVSYKDFVQALDSNQPSHNVRVFIGNRPILLTKIMVRQFRNGPAAKDFNNFINNVKTRGYN